VLWLRRDLRVADHPALARALASSGAVVPLFVWDEELLRPAGAARLSFLAGCLRELNGSLDGRLVVRCGDPAKVVPQVADSVAATAVHVSADHGPYGRARDRRVEEALRRAGVAWRPSASPYAVEPGTLVTGAGSAFQVFTPFSKAWRSATRGPVLGVPPLALLSDGGLASDLWPDIPAGPPGMPAPGESAAHARLELFLSGAVNNYDRHRDRPDLDGCSRLSPYLRFGCLHPRQVLERLDLSRPDHRRFETELCWREFYAHVLADRPDSARRPYRPEWEAFEVDRDPPADEHFRAWCEGRTGYPIVDAGMRQLLHEGWMHNRVRMITASFLVKDLHLDWRLGARWFMRHLADGDLASNQLNWQWVAGSGTDAAPYFRIFNPVTQGKRFDPEGSYIRAWVPELAGVGPDEIHEPWRRAVTLPGMGPDYPLPLVEHPVEREESLARYGRLLARRGR